MSLQILLFYLYPIVFAQGFVILDSFSSRYQEKHKEINDGLKRKESELNGTGIITLTEFRKIILTNINTLRCKKVIDIACGENDLAYDFALLDGIEGIWVNDIAWNYIRTIHKGCFKHFARRRNNLIFTNHDAVRTPFEKGFFDLAFSKNLLHHLYSYEFCEDFLREARRIGNFLFLIEFAHPEEQTSLGKELHYSYYRETLKEPDDCYYVYRDDFDRLTSAGFIKKRHYSDVIHTVKGSYNVSLLEFTQ